MCGLLIPVTCRTVGLHRLRFTPGHFITHDDIHWWEGVLALGWLKAISTVLRKWHLFVYHKLDVYERLTTQKNILSSPVHIIWGMSALPRSTTLALYSQSRIPEHPFPKTWVAKHCLFLTGFHYIPIGVGRFWNKSCCLTFNLDSRKGQTAAEKITVRIA